LLTEDLGSVELAIIGIAVNMRRPLLWTEGPELC
jgi:hypothetical protein